MTATPASAAPSHRWRLIAATPPAATGETTAVAPLVVPVACSSAWENCAAVAYRSAGTTASAFVTTWSTASGTVGRPARRSAQAP